MQANPGAELTQRMRKIQEACAQHLPLPPALGVFDVEAVGRGVLADDQQLLDAGLHQAFGLAHHLGHGRLASRPRRLGMMQNEQRLLQPSEIFRYA